MKTFLACAVIAGCFATSFALMHCSSSSLVPPTAASAGPPPASLGAPMLHRASAASCPTVRAPSFGYDGGGYDGPFDQCTKDSQCTSGTNGRCSGVYNSEACACDYDQCDDDGACSDGGVCGCRSGPDDHSANVCYSSGNCRVDSDCGAGGYCSPSQLPNDVCNGDNVAYFCHTTEDECVNDSQCSTAGPPPMLTGPCMYVSSKGRWACFNTFYGCDSGVIRCGGGT